MPPCQVPTLLSIGHGYVAQALARRLRPLGLRVIGTTRSPGKAARLDVEARIWPGDDLSDLLTEATHVLSSVAPQEGADPVLQAFGAQIADAGPRWVGYLSTTGVYGDRSGGWVDETSELRPSTDRGAARVAAERGWQALGVPLHIFRLPGIYGRGRSALDRLRAGTARRIVKPGQVFSRAHVEDIAQVLAASMERPAPGIYNVADDEPAPPQDVIAFAAELLGVTTPPEVPFDEAELSPMARSFYSESKRVRNDLIKRKLGVRLLYPTYREGLSAIRATERS